MSVICDVAILTSMHERKAFEAVNRKLYEIDESRHQQFRALDTSNAGGVKVYCGQVWAGAFNHLVPDDIDDAIIEAPWDNPEEVVVWVDAYDYGYRPVARTVAQMREGATLGEPQL